MLLCEVTMPECDTCNNYEWDEDTQEYFCRLMQEGKHHSGCPYWQSDDEYAVVRHQAF